MESNSQADEPPQRSIGWGANFMGTAVAAFTLIMPLYVTTYYSRPDLSLEPPISNQNLSQYP